MNQAMLRMGYNMSPVYSCSGCYCNVDCFISWSSSCRSTKSGSQTWSRRTSENNNINESIGKGISDAVNELFGLNYNYMDEYNCDCSLSGSRTKWRFWSWSSTNKSGNHWNKQG